MSTQSLKWLGTAVRFRAFCVTRLATAELSSGNHSNFTNKQYINSNMEQQRQHPDGNISPKVLTKGSPLPPLKKGVMRLYNMRFCPFAHRARLILANKEEPYETVNIHLSKKPEWFVNKSPNQQVPAVEHDDRIVYDSLVVAEYLDGLLKSKLVSTDPYRKAHDSLLITYNGTMLVPNYYKIIDTKGEDTEINEAFRTAMEKLETTLKERKSNFFAGDKPGYVDYMIWPWQERFFLFKKYPKVYVIIDKLPLLKQWQTRMMEDPAVKKCAQTVQRHDDFIVSWKNGDDNPYDIGLDDEVDFPAYK